MTTAVIRHFDILAFVNKAKESGINPAFAEYTARQLEQLSETLEKQDVKIDALTAKEPATKGDVRESELRLQKEIEIVKNDTFRFIVYTGVGVCIYLTGATYTMLKLLH